jgi:hypothetical protein
MTSAALPQISVNLPSLSSESDEANEGIAALFPSLTLKERLVGFGVCVLLGFLISVSAFGSFSDLLLGYPARFAILYSLGNLTSLGSTMFLVGPKHQFRNMTHHSRRSSAGIYVACMILTPCVAYLLPDYSWLIILLVASQWVALGWYALSYIPFGRRMAAGLARRLLA